MQNQHEVVVILNEEFAVHRDKVLLLGDQRASAEYSLHKEGSAIGVCKLSWKFDWTIDVIIIDEAFQGQGLCTKFLSASMSDAFREWGAKPERGFVQIDSYNPAAARKCQIDAARANGFDVVSEDVGLSLFDAPSIDEYERQKSKMIRPWRMRIYFQLRSASLATDALRQTPAQIKSRARLAFERARPYD